MPNRFWKTHQPSEYLTRALVAERAARSVCDHAFANCTRSVGIACKGNYYGPTFGGDIAAAECLETDYPNSYDAKPSRATIMHEGQASRDLDAGKLESGEGPLVVNLDKALERLDQDRSLFNEMAGFFLTDSPALIDMIHATLASREQQELARAAHTLKNLAATCGGERAANAASKVEQLGLAGAWDSISAALAALEGELATLSERLRGLAWES